MARPTFQKNLGTFVFSVFLGFDTFLFLTGIVFAREIDGAELAGAGIAFLFAIISTILIPIYFFIIKSLRRFMESPKWDFYLLYPFTIINFLILIWLISTPFRDQIAARKANDEDQPRIQDEQIIASAIKANIADHRGRFVCGAGNLPDHLEEMASKPSATGRNYDIAPCLVPTYLKAMPFDSTDPAAYYASNDDYDTGYIIVVAEGEILPTFVNLRSVMINQFGLPTVIEVPIR